MLLNEKKKRLTHVRIILTCCIAATAKYGFQHQMVKKDGEKENKSIEIIVTHWKRSGCLLSSHHYIRSPYMITGHMQHLYSTVLLWLPPLQIYILWYYFLYIYYNLGSWYFFFAWFGARTVRCLRNTIFCPKLSILYKKFPQMIHFVSILLRYLISNHINHRSMQLALDTLIRFLAYTSEPQIPYIWLQLFCNN